MMRNITVDFLDNIAICVYEFMQHYLIWINQKKLQLYYENIQIIDKMNDMIHIEFYDYIKNV